MRPRPGLLALGFLLMVINKLAGFVLPYSSKFLIDNVVGKHETGLLRSLVVSVLIATVVQGVTFIFPDAIALESCSTVDCRSSPTSTDSCFTGSRRLLRCEQNRRTGLARS